MSDVLSVVLLCVLVLVAIPATVSSVYLLLLTLLSGRLAPMPSSRRALRFDIIVPAHNEIAVIERTVRSLRAVDWPEEQFRVIVVADNCEDETAELAAAAGAMVLEREDPARRGKGYALEFAFARSRDDAFADAVVVVDADSVVSANLLEACATRIESGASAVQANYGVLNPEDSWRTRLITVAYGAFHIVRSRARERLRVSCGLRGNGMCFTHSLLRRFPFAVFSIAEDLEYGVELGFHGIRIHYADEAHVDGEIVASERGARSQRQRWERGRFAVIRQYGFKAFVEGLRRPSRVCLDLSMDLLVLPLSYVVLQVFALLVLSLLALPVLESALAWVIWALLLGACIGLYVLRGWRVTGLGWRALLDLARAPFFIVWKLVVMLRDRGSAGWVKTERERP